jgi:two-component system chemotaxis response regulator CheB
MGDGVLIIDDDEDDCMELEESLIHVGSRVRVDYRMSAESGLKFLNEHKNDLPKIVVIDMNMPGMDGISVLRQIMDNYPVMTIMHATSCNESLAREVKSLGGIDCVQKGTSYADNLRFARRVLELLNGSGQMVHKTE